MSLPQFQFKQVADNTVTTLSSLVRVINDLFSNLNQIFTALLKKVQLDSSILQNVSLQVGTNTIPHGLGRTLSGWKPVRLRNISPQLYDLQDTSPAPETYLYLVSNVAAVIDIEVF